jgi:hypothetical protein
VIKNRIALSVLSPLFLREEKAQKKKHPTVLLWLAGTRFTPTSRRILFFFREMEKEKKNQKKKRFSACYQEKLTRKLTIAGNRRPFGQRGRGNSL